MARDARENETVTMMHKSCLTLMNLSNSMIIRTVDCYVRMIKVIMFCILGSQLANADVTTEVRTEVKGSPTPRQGTTGYVRPGLPSVFYRQGANCSEFIKPTGVYGRYGESIVAEINKNPRYQSVLIEDKSKAIARDPQMKAICPNFVNLSADEKKRFWVWTFASIAWDEARCTNPRRTQCTFANCIGIMQVDELESRRYWRGPGCRGRSMARPEDAFRCSLEIMRGQYEGFYGRPPSLRKSYWQKLRGAGTGGSVKERMKLFPGCKVNGSTK